MRPAGCFRSRRGRAWCGTVQGKRPAMGGKKVEKTHTKKWEKSGRTPENVGIKQARHTAKCGKKQAHHTTKWEKNRGTSHINVRGKKAGTQTKHRKKGVGSYSPCWPHFPPQSHLVEALAGHRMQRLGSCASQHPTPSPHQSHGCAAPSKCQPSACSREPREGTTEPGNKK